MAGVRVQLHGRFAVHVDGRSVEALLPGRRSRLLVAYLATHRHTAVDRSSLIEVLWHPSVPDKSAAAGFAALLSKTRAVLAPIEIRGRGSLRIVFPPGTIVDAAVAAAALHDAHAAVGTADWKLAWTRALSTVFVTQRQFLSDLDHPWVDDRRRDARQEHDQALVCYAEACLQLGGVELASAERSAHSLIASQPFSEAGYCLLMRALIARGDHGAALAVYDRLRRTLRDELGISPGPAAQNIHARML